MTKKMTRVEFVGGPLCGKRDRIPDRQLAEYMVCQWGKNEREYIYTFCLKVGTPTKAANRYLFLGHEATLPDDIKEMRDGE